MLVGQSNNSYDIDRLVDFIRETVTDHFNGKKARQQLTLKGDDIMLYRPTWRINKNESNLVEDEMAFLFYVCLVAA